MNFLYSNECNSNGWNLYWARTHKEWRHSGKGVKDAYDNFHKLLRDYRLSVSSFSVDDNNTTYDYWFERGALRRLEGFVETMGNNTYSGSTWLGLYAYMDGMEFAK